MAGPGPMSRFLIITARDDKAARMAPLERAAADFLLTFFDDYSKR
jgi:hypothetical protein